MGEVSDVNERVDVVVAVMLTGTGMGRVVERPAGGQSRQLGQRALPQRLLAALTAPTFRKACRSSVKARADLLAIQRVDRRGRYGPADLSSIIITQ